MAVLYQFEFAAPLRSKSRSSKRYSGANWLSMVVLAAAHSKIHHGIYQTAA